MSILNKVTAKMPKYNPEMKILSPENRGFLLFSGVSVVLSAAILAIWLSNSDEAAKKAVSLNSIDVNTKNKTVDSEVSPLYKQSIKELNKDSYEKASQKISGASMPILYHDKPDTKYESIEGCGCTFDDKAKSALLEELKRLGITGISKRDGLRLGKSDIYVQGDGTLVDEKGAPYLWGGEPVRTDDKGAVLISISGMPIITSDSQGIYLSNEGKFYNEATAIVRLLGQLLSEDGVIVLGTGFKANKPGGMTQVDSTDVYVTRESQLATMDGKPIYHSSKYVFKDMDNRLHNNYGEDLSWEEKIVFQQKNGSITDRTNKQFSRIGVLISYGGILIDNNSMLTADLKDIKRFGESDLFVNEQSQLVDSFGERVTHLNYFIRLGVNNSLISEIGPVTNSSNAELYLKESGRFYAERPVYLTGTVKDSTGVAYDKYGHRITRRGKLIQLANSVIWHTPDRYLATEDGLSIQYKGRDLFQDISRFKIINAVDAYGLKDIKGMIIKDLLGKEIYLNNNGELIYADGQMVKESGILTNSNGVVITSTGELIVGGSKKAALTDQSGNQVYYNGKKVYQGADGKLYDKDGNLLKSTDGRALVLLPNGSLTDEDGNILPSSLLSTMDAVNNNREFYASDSGLLLNRDGDPLYYKGKKVFQGADGKLYTEDGKLITSKDGKPLELIDGVISDLDGNAVQLDGFALEKNTTTFSPLGNAGFTSNANGEVLDEDGNELYYKGKKVYQGADGKLYDLDGNELKGSDGKPLRLKDGVIYNTNGDRAKMDGFEVAALDYDYDGLASNDGLIVEPSGYITDEKGNLLFYKGQKVRRGENGSLYDENGALLTDTNGMPLSFKNGSIVDINEKPVASDDLKVASPKLKMKPVTKNSGFISGKAGQIFDKDGNALFYNGKKVYQGSDGKLYDEYGGLITNNSGESLRLNERGQIVSPNGSEASLEKFEVATINKKLKPVGNKGFKKSSGDLLLDGDGEALYYEGKAVKIGPDSRLYDSNGKLITSSNGETFRLNSNGEIVNQNGDLASLSDFEASKNSKFLSPINNSGFSTADEDIVVDATGNPLTFNGKKITQGDDGFLYDDSGVLITDELGNPLTLKGGAIVNSDGVPVDMKSFRVSRAKDNKRFKTKSDNSSLTQLGDSGIYTTNDGLFVDKNGKPIVYKGKRVRKGKDGKLYDENGRVILDELGRPLSINENGEVVDVNGNKVDGIHFQNGNGQYLSGEDGAPNVRRLGNSDLYITREGLLTDDQGRPMLHKEKPIKIGAGGRLMTTDGDFITDVNGNGVMLTNDGELKNKEGQPSKGGILQDADGVTLDSKGLRVTNGGKLTSLGNGLYKTEDGLIVDRGGKPVLIDEKQSFVNAEGEIVDAGGRSVRFQGKRIYLSDTGSLSDAQGNRLTSENQSVSLTSKGLVRDDGVLISIPKEEEVESTTANRALLEELEKSQQNNDSNTTDSDDEPVGNELKDSRTEAKAVNKDLQLDKLALAKVIDTSTLTNAEIIALNQRYHEIYSSIEAKLTKYEKDFNTTPKSSIAQFAETPANSKVESDVSVVGTSVNTSQDGMNGSVIKKQKAGTSIYAANKMTVNTDLNTKVVFDVMGLPHTHPLYRSTAHGQVSLKYDNVVIEFSAICPEVGECYSIDGIAIDPATRSASINGEIDKHYWYRFGGLTLASLAQGVGMGMSESREKTESFDEEGKKVTYSGLSGSELLVRAAEPVGEALSGVFMENVNRPYTGIIKNGEEVGIFLFEDIALRESLKK